MTKKDHGRPRTYAERHLPRGTWRGGRCGPKDEPDEVAVERLVRGINDFGHGNADRNAALDRLDVRGATAREVALLLGTTTRTVQRRREKRRALGIDPSLDAGRGQS